MGSLEEMYCSSGRDSNEHENDKIFNEADVPGASLNGREPNSLKIPGLKHWLQCQRAPTKGKKADLVSRLAK